MIISEMSDVVQESQDSTEDSLEGEQTEQTEGVEEVAPTMAQVIAERDQYRTLSDNLLKTVDNYSTRPAPAAPPAPALKPATVITEADMENSDAFSSKLDVMLQEKLAPYVTEVSASNAQRAYQDFLRDNPDLGKYRTEIDELSRGLTVRQAANPSTWTQVGNHIRQAHQQDFIDAEVEKRMKAGPAAPPPTAEGGSVQPVGAADLGGATRLSQAEKNVADGLGIGHKQFAANKKALGL